MSEAVLFFTTCALTVGGIPPAGLRLPQGPGVMEASSSALSNAIHPIPREVVKMGRMNPPGHVSASTDDRGSRKGLFTRGLTSGRLKLVEVSLSFCKKRWCVAASAFLSFLRVLMLKTLKQNVLLFFDDCIS